MTIAIGFRCKDGVVLATDTQITKVASKNYEAKIFSINKWQDSFLAYSGDNAFAKQLVGSLKTTTEDLAGDDLFDAIRNKYRSLHKEFWSDAPKAEKTYSQIIFTVRQGKRISVYASEDGRKIYDLTASDSDSDDSSPLYLPIGSGASTARPYLATYYSKYLSVEEVTNLAIYTLWKIKPYAEDCGGSTHVVCIKDKQPDWLGFEFASHRLSREEIKDVENDFAFYETNTKEMFLRFPHCDVRINKDFNASLRYVASTLREYRTKKLSRKEREQKRLDREYEKGHP